LCTTVLQKCRFIAHLTYVNNDLFVGTDILNHINDQVCHSDRTCSTYFHTHMQAISKVTTQLEKILCPWNWHCRSYKQIKNCTNQCWIKKNKLIGKFCFYKHKSNYSWGLQFLNKLWTQTCNGLWETFLFYTDLNSKECIACTCTEE